MHKIGMFNKCLQKKNRMILWFQHLTKLVVQWNLEHRWDSSFNLKLVKTSSILSHIVLVIYKTKNINTHTRTRNLQKKYDSELTYRYSPQDCLWLWIATTVDKLGIIERIFRVNANLTSTVDFWIKTCWVPTGII